jgi:Alr-MurF fusion protein
MVMVKALAYGTDDIRIAKFLKSCEIDILGVSYVDEGVQMRQAGVKQHIFVLNAAEYEAAKAVKWDLEVGVSEPTLVQALQEQALTQGKKVKVHLHVDTGMSRLGCRIEQVLSLAQAINTCPNLIFEGIFTHFACADDPNQDEFTQ